jgi:hypothetical protein
MDRYEEVTLGMLEEAARIISPATLDEPMLQSEYWVEQIQEATLALRGSDIMPWGEWMM